MSGEREAFWNRQPLGTMPDMELARRLSCSASVIQKQRRRRGIPAFDRFRPSRQPAAHHSEPVDSPEYFNREHVGSPEYSDVRADVVPVQNRFDALYAFCRGAPRTLDQLCDHLGCGPTRIQQLIGEAQRAGYPLQLHGDRLTWHLPTEWAEDEYTAEVAQPIGGWFLLAIVSDTHFGSKWTRLDFLADFFERAYARGCRLFLHAGDMLDGEYRHGLRERRAHGFDEQAAVAIEALPRGDGAHWLFIDGNHDETLTKAGGAVAGRALVERAASSGRTDLTFLGQRKGLVRLASPTHSYKPLVELWHPRPGRAYAQSYQLQKKCEAYRPGHKPDLLLAGHWHTFCYIHERGIHALSCGTFQGHGASYSNSLVGSQAIGGTILSYVLTEHGTLRHVCVERVPYYEREVARVVEVEALP